MNSEQVKTVNKKFNCLECGNEVEVAENLKVGDVIECEYCGIEYEIVESIDNEYILQLIEEEK
jgi:lysine biosynthesis protein LysW